MKNIISKNVFVLFLLFQTLLFSYNWFPFAPNPPDDAFPLLLVPAMDLFLLRQMSHTL
jgi:hypothetical protein